MSTETIGLPESKLTKQQYKSFGPRAIEGYGPGAAIWAHVRFDDECGNGHNTFAITADVRVPKQRDIAAGGCLHEEIAKAFPELVKYIKWHLVSTDGPMHYIANTAYLAGDRDCHGLLKDERRQLRNGKTGQLAWKLEATVELPKYIDADQRPTESAILRYVPWDRIGEGKARELDSARHAAVWPEATDEELTAPDLKDKLTARLPKLMEEFKAAMEELGLVY